MICGHWVVHNSCANTRSETRPLVDLVLSLRQSLQQRVVVRGPESGALECQWFLRRFVLESVLNFYTTDGYTL